MPSAEKPRTEQKLHEWNKAIRAPGPSSACPRGSPVGLTQSEPRKHFGDLVKNGDFCYLFFFFSWMHLEVRLESMILSISPFFPSGLFFFLRHCTQADNPKETNISTRSNHTTEIKPSPLVFAFSNSGQTSNKAPEAPLHPSALKLPPPCWAHCPSHPPRTHKEKWFFL